VEFTDDYVFFKVDKIRKEKVENLPVYNIEVEEDNSYCLPMIAVHNCQAFSVAGKRLGFEDTRGTLFFEIARIAKEKRPKVLLLENVKGLINHDKGKTIETIIHILNDIGYIVDFTVLNSKYFGVPQNRERVFFVCIREDLFKCEQWKIEGNDVVAKAKKRLTKTNVIKTFNFDWPAQEKVISKLRDILEDNVDEKYYLSEEKTAKLIAQLTKESLKRIDNFIIDDQGRSKKAIKPLEIAPTLRRETHGNDPRVVEPILVGKLTLPGKDQWNRVYSTEGISPTLVTMQGGRQEPKIAVQMKQHEIGKETDISHCLAARDYKGFGNQYMTGIIEEIRPVLTPDRETKRQNGRRFKEDGEESFTLTAQDRHGVIIGVSPYYRIRKLTPLECWRLMGFDDEDFYKAKQALNEKFYRGKDRSDSQLYKQAGNSIVVNVLEAILHKLFKNKII
ncbi:MAG TPA: DNA (cytosine-5-)-methyltransferase, partial [Bacilli bacterium]